MKKRARNPTLMGGRGRRGMTLQDLQRLKFLKEKKRREEATKQAHRQRVRRESEVKRDARHVVCTDTLVRVKYVRIMWTKVVL